MTTRAFAVEAPDEVLQQITRDPPPDVQVGTPTAVAGQAGSLNAPVGAVPPEDVVKLVVVVLTTAKSAFDFAKLALEVLRSRGRGVVRIKDAHDPARVVAVITPETSEEELRSRL